MTSREQWHLADSEEQEADVQLSEHIFHATPSQPCAHDRQDIRTERCCAGIGPDLSFLSGPPLVSGPFFQRVAFLSASKESRQLPTVLGQLHR